MSFLFSKLEQYDEHEYIHLRLLHKLLRNQIRKLDSSSHEILSSLSWPFGSAHIHFELRQADGLLQICLNRYPALEWTQPRYSLNFHSYVCYFQLSKLQL